MAGFVKNYLEQKTKHSTKIYDPKSVMSPATAAVAQTKPLSPMQKALVGLAANLPPAPGINLQTYLANLKATGPQPAPATALASVHDARDYVKRQAGNYFQSR